MSIHQPPGDALGQRLAGLPVGAGQDQREPVLADPVDAVDRPRPALQHGGHGTTHAVALGAVEIDQDEREQATVAPAPGALVRDPALVGVTVAKAGERVVPGVLARGRLRRRVRQVSGDRARQQRQRLGIGGGECLWVVGVDAERADRLAVVDEGCGQPVRRDGAENVVVDDLVADRELDRGSPARRSPRARARPRSGRSRRVRAALRRSRSEPARWQAAAVPCPPQTDRRTGARA